MYCPYHGVDHPPDTAFNLEHIIPYAAGGSGLFAIFVCTQINSRFGAELDAPFLDVFPVSCERFARGIKSQSGNEPTLVLQGLTEIEGKTVQIIYEISANEKRLLVDPDVQSVDVAAGKRYHVRASLEEAEEILRNIDRKATRRGQIIVDVAGKPVSIDGLLEKAEIRKLVPTIESRWNFRAWEIAAQREFVKIALGACHFLLKEPYSRSPDADLLRKFLNSADEDLDKVPILGTVWPAVVANPLLPFRGILGDPGQHIVALLHLTGRLVVYISLFGELSANLVISEDAEICDLVKRDDGYVMQIDPISRNVVQRRFTELLQMMAREAENKALGPSAGDVDSNE